jgi:hypothetical protein
MTWCWIAIVPAEAPGATASAALFERDGMPAGRLAAWRRRARPVRHALRADDRMIDPRGAEGWISLVLPPDGVRLPFDDLAVQHARREVLARSPMDAVTTLLRDASHFEGALTVARADRAARLVDDPFARVFPQRILRVDAGVLGDVAAPCGPTIERYGSSQPWPWDRFNAP